MTTTRKINLAVSLAIGLAGFVLILNHTDWRVATGVLFLLWGNNFERQTRGTR